MKNRTGNIFRFYFLAGLVVVLAFAEGDVFAQGEMSAKSFSIQIPIMVHYDYFSNVPGSTAHYIKDSITILDIHSLGDPLLSYLKKEDTIKLLYGEMSLNVITHPIELQFVLDTLEKKLKDFSISYETRYPESPYSNLYLYARFSALAYKLIEDSLFVVSDSGSQCIKNFENANYKYSSFRDYSTGYVAEDNHIVSLLSDDTSVYKCFATFVLTKSVAYVLQPHSVHTSFIALNFLPDHTIHFSFPSSSHSQSMPIYEILGREISKIEIPAGSSSYVLQSAGFPKGTYFARLGSSFAHFVVN